MLFNSYEFLIFLPLVVAVYFLLNRQRLTIAAKLWLLSSSFFFYAYMDVSFLPILLLSIGVNFLIGKALGGGGQGTEAPDRVAKGVLTLGVVFNLGLLGVFKYTDFFIRNYNFLLSEEVRLTGLILPLGISFFTFQQISFLVDSYKGTVREHGLLDYSLFVSFFPQLIAGPIVHHREMMPQFKRARNLVLSYRHIYRGMLLFSIGLVKKTVIADSLAQWANGGFSAGPGLHLVDAWATSLSYTFQIYFDFSGYMDMATGAALMLNIVLPRNFNSPYLALSVQDFWRRWHITLGRFLTEYVYIPLGGSRKGTWNTVRNYMIVFVLGGFWHGAGWTFIIWGALNGLALTVNLLWKRYGVTLPTALAWLATFAFTNVSWVFFRADSVQGALDVIRGMVGLNGVALHPYLEGPLSFLADYGIRFAPFEISELHGTVFFCALIAFCLVSHLTVRPVRDWGFSARATVRNDVIIGAATALGIASLSSISEFIYFQF